MNSFFLVNLFRLTIWYCQPKDPNSPSRNLELFKIQRSSSTDLLSHYDSDIKEQKPEHRKSLSKYFSNLLISNFSNLLHPNAVLMNYKCIKIRLLILMSQTYSTHGRLMAIPDQGFMPWRAVWAFCSRHCWQCLLRK